MFNFGDFLCILLAFISSIMYRHYKFYLVEKGQVLTTVSQGMVVSHRVVDDCIIVSLLIVEHNLRLRDTRIVNSDGRFSRII